MKKLIVKILIVICIVILSFGMIIAGTGYNMYKKALENTPLNEMVKQIKEKDNYTTLDEMPEIYKKAVVAVEDHRLKIYILLRKRSLQEKQRKCSWLLK